jgi:hypothetical protein
MLDRFHSKNHRYNHHTLPTPGVFDSASDPIAAPSDPFQGDFHAVGTVSATFLEGASAVRVGRGSNRGSIVPSAFSAFRTFTLPDNSGTIVLSTTIASYLSSGPDAYITASMVWVDSLSGSDLSGARERPDKPFKTLAAAQGAALAGDLVWVRPGLYTETNLGKNGVSWYFDPNTQLSANAPIAPFFNYSSKVYSVFGYPSFTVTGLINPYGSTLVADFGSSVAGTDIVFEFNNITVDSSSTIQNTPTAGVFKGTLGGNNLLIRGNNISAPKLAICSALKSGSSGYTIALDVQRSIVGQTVLYDTFQNFSGYVRAPLISASDYLYDDANNAVSVATATVHSESVVGAVLKTGTTGPLRITTKEMTVSPRSGCVWTTTATGPVDIEAESFTTTIKLDTNSQTSFDLGTFTTTSTTPASAGLSYALSFQGTLYFDADLVTVTYAASSYGLFYTNTDASRLVANVYRIDDASNGGYDVVYVNSTSATKVEFHAHKIDNGNFHLFGTNLKVRVDVENADNTYIHARALSASTDSVFYVNGLIHTLSANNMMIDGVSGQSGTKLYIEGGSMLTNPTNYTLNLGSFIGTPLSVYILGTVATNQTPLYGPDNFVVKCGQFETEASIEVPSF